MNHNIPSRLDFEMCWTAVENRDADADGTFVFAVHSTGIYCRPSCPSRRPRKDGISFYADGATARAAGYRACLRCQPDVSETDEIDWVKQVCTRIDANLGELLTLEKLGVELHISPDHLRKTFKRVMGVTPRQYMEAKRMEKLKTSLREKARVTDALYEAGFNSSSQLYESGGFGMTPTDYKNGGQGVEIGFVIVGSDVGLVLVAATEKGVTAVRLGDSPEALEADLRKEFPEAVLRYDKSGMDHYANAILQHLEGKNPRLQLPLDLRATAFQQRVWQALQAIPYGSTRSYGDIAKDIGQPTAARAVARACATNPAALVIPCHRVVESGGGVGGYRWGVARKEKILTQEQKVVQEHQAEGEHVL